MNTPDSKALGKKLLEKNQPVKGFWDWFYGGSKWN
jgi:hypothetical protein